MHPDPSNILFALIAVSLVFLLLALLIGIMIYLHKKKVQTIQLEKKILADHYEKTLLQSQIEVQELTYSSLGKELHDNIGQLLSTAKMLIGITQMKYAVPPDTLNTANETLGKAIQEIRSLSKVMDKEWLEQFDFSENLQTEINRINSGQTVKISYVADQLNLLKPGEQLILFRIIQEAIQNAIKHANPSCINVTIRKNSNDMVFTIEDNGTGLRNDEEQKGMGVTNMKHRAKLLGGEISWHSEPSKGTTVILILPLKY